MTRKEALDFLRQHQPLPADKDLSREIVDKYDESRKYFLANSDPVAVPLLLNSFGEGSGFGVYQLVGDVIAKLPNEIVVPHLAAALESEHRGIRYWNAQIAARFPEPELTPSLAKLLLEPDHDLRYAAITALEQIGDETAMVVLREALRSEMDEEIRDLLREVLQPARSDR